MRKLGRVTSSLRAAPVMYNMSAPWSLLLALSLSLGSIFYNLWSRTRRLHGLDGPDSPSFFLGHVVDLRRAPLGTRWNVWQRKYGATYRVMGVLLVSED
jgi:hypothetical protein